MQRRWTRSFQRGLNIVMLVLMGAALAAVPAQAAPRITPAASDSLTLTLNNGPTFTYIGQPGGTVVPMFTATLTYATKPTMNYASHD